MRIRDLKQSDIKVGLKIRSLTNYERIAEIVKIDEDDDFYAWIKWPEDDKSYGGFYGTDNDCEVVEENPYKIIPKWNVIDDNTDFKKIPKDDLFILIEHNPNVEWGNDDTNPYTRRAKLVKTENPEYSWELLDYNEDFENKHLNQEFTVMAYRPAN